jgi:hypothetical protein
MDALEAHELLTPRFDVAEATLKVRAALPKILELKPMIAKRFPGFDIGYLEMLEPCIQAVIDAYSTREDQVSQQTLDLAAEGMLLHDKLLFDAHRWAKMGLVSSKFLKGLRGTQTYAALAVDLLHLAVTAQYLCERDEQVSCTQTELLRAEGIGLELDRSAAQDLQMSSNAVDDERRRAFTLFSRVYEEVRQVVSCVRFNDGDVDALAPPLYVKPSRKPKQAKQAKQVTPDSPRTNDSSSPKRPNLDPHLN